MDLAAATKEILLGASILQAARAYRQALIDAFGFRPDEITGETFAVETETFVRKLCRHLGDRHAGEPQVGHALRDWVMLVDHYEAWDALLSGFEFAGKSALIRRGKVLFAGPMTAHWESDERE